MEVSTGIVAYEREFLIRTNQAEVVRLIRDLFHQDGIPDDAVVEWVPSELVAGDIDIRIGWATEDGDE